MAEPERVDTMTVQLRIGSTLPIGTGRPDVPGGYTFREMVYVGAKCLYHSGGYVACFPNGKRRYVVASIVAGANHWTIDRVIVGARSQAADDAANSLDTKCTCK